MGFWMGLLAAFLVWGMFHSACRPGPVDQPQSVERPAKPVLQVGKYYFADNADLCVHLTIKVEDFRADPIGGAVMVHPPKGEAYRDAPGETHQTHFQAGPWMWCKLEEDGLGVEIKDPTDP